MTLDSAATTLIIGVPSLAVAIATYVFSTRAHRQQMEAAAAREDSAGVTAEAGAYARARLIDESAIAELRRQVTDLRAEITQLRADLADTRASLVQAQTAADELRTQIAALQGGGQGKG